jgi:mannosyltransferase
MFYNIAHCLVYISSCEGFGFPLLEAQKAGCPVIAFRNSSIPEVLSSNASMIKELNTNMLKMRLDDLEGLPYRNTIIEEGLTNSEHFSWDKCYNETIGFYGELYEMRNNIKGNNRLGKKLKPRFEDLLTVKK